MSLKLAANLFLVSDCAHSRSQPSENTYTINEQTRWHRASPQVTQFSLLPQSLEVEKNPTHYDTQSALNLWWLSSRRSFSEGGGKIHPALCAPPEGAVTPGTSASGSATFRRTCTKNATQWRWWCQPWTTRQQERWWRQDVKKCRLSGCGEWSDRSDDPAVIQLWSCDPTPDTRHMTFQWWLCSVSTFPVCRTAISTWLDVC